MDFSNKYVLGFATALCLLCAGAVSVLATSLKPQIELNKKLDQQRKILWVSGLAAADDPLPPERVEELYGFVKGRVIDRETASLIEGVTERDLERLRNRVATGVTLSGERPEGRMHRLGRQWATGSPYRSLADELESITSVTHDDLRRVGQRYPIARGALVGTLRPA